MAEEVKNCNLSNNLILETTATIKQEFEDDGSYIDFSETSINVKNEELEDKMHVATIKEYKTLGTINDIYMEFDTHNIMKDDNVKIEETICDDDIKIEFHNNPFCDYCNEDFEDYCTKCGMLTHILNGIAHNNPGNRLIKEIPNGILEIRESSGHVGVFALKVIPQSVKIGPFSGLDSSVCPWRLKGGKFILNEDKSMLLDWMQHINTARTIFEHNLFPFLCEDKLYYHSRREILAGEELLVYFGEEYEDSINKDVEMDFIPSLTEETAKDIFACAFCCLGFSLREYLVKHRSNCRNPTNSKFSIDELTQCTSCKIYFYEKDYLDWHKPYCCERNISDDIPVLLDSRKECKSKTAYGCDLETRVEAKHLKEFKHKCEICTYQASTKLHLERHIKSIHLKEFEYKCTLCKYQRNRKESLEVHIKSIHLKEFDYKCTLCKYQGNRKESLEVHIKTKHLKQFSHECEICKYKTNRKACLKRHIRAVHLKEIDNKCDKCDYKTNDKGHLARHIKTKHLKEFNYQCDKCDYKTNVISYLDYHTKHLKEYSYKCDASNYKTNGKCEYKTNRKSNLEQHIKTIHLKELN